MEEELVQEEAVRELPFEDMMKLFETLTFREKWAKVRYGLKQPKESGEYKWAALQMRRLVSPISAVVVPALGLLLMVALAGMAPARQRSVNIRIPDDTAIPELEEMEIPEEEPPPPDPEHIVDPSDNFIPSTSKSQVGPDVDFSPTPAQFDSVAIIRSPVIMRGVFGSRSPGARGSLLGRNGGGGHTEAAVMRALRWLKKNQAGDGSWLGGRGLNNVEVKAAMTGLALLTFLAHGETTGSPEFGETVAKAIKWLVDHQIAGGGWDREYQHPIATYALCEAYGMTRIPEVRDAAERGLDIVIAGQNAAGGWRYTMTSGDGSDASVMSWCVQALKAGHIAGLERPGLESAMKRAIKGWQGNYKGNSQMGEFQYLPGNDLSKGLTGAGVLSLQLLGAAQTSEAQGGIRHLIANRNTFNWDAAGWKDIYYWYYETQARFQEGGASWRDWNSKFSVPLVKAQEVIPKAIADLEGNMVDIGYWCKGSHRVMTTAMSALQLMVYYRYLPTFMKVEDIIAAEAGQPGVAPAPDVNMDLEL
jgi:hypothetical protein